MLESNQDIQKQNSLRILEGTHQFPCAVMIKIIGYADGYFLDDVLAAVRTCQAFAEAPSYRTRSTPSGKYLAVTMEPLFQSADEVLLLYERIRVVRGVVMVL
jgi:uncharacterized protein